MSCPFHCTLFCKIVCVVLCGVMLCCVVCQFTPHLIHGLPYDCLKMYLLVMVVIRHLTSYQFREFIEIPHEHSCTWILLVFNFLIHSGITSS